MTTEQRAALERLRIVAGGSVRRPAARRVEGWRQVRVRAEHGRSTRYELGYESPRKARNRIQRQTKRNRHDRHIRWRNDRAICEQAILSQDRPTTDHREAGQTETSVALSSLHRYRFIRHGGRVRGSECLRCHESGHWPRDQETAATGRTWP